MSQRSAKPRRHRGAAPHPRGADPGPRRQTLCNIDRNGAGARDSLTPHHKSTAAQFLSWFDELAAVRARSLRELAECNGITRRYVRRLVDLAFLSPELVEAILQGRQPVELTATRLTELDLPLDWTDQRSLLAS